MLEMAVDYLSGISLFDDMKSCEEFIDDLAGLMSPKDEIYIENKETTLGERFTMRVGSVFKMYGGIRVTKEEKIKLALQLPGQFCRRFGNEQEAITMFGETMRPTRVDLRLDDYKRRITQEGVNTIANKGHYKGVDSYELISSKGGQDAEAVKTCYFGSSLKEMRFYNAEAIHGFQADRWELQARGHYSEEVLVRLLENVSNKKKLTQTMGGIVTSCIDFVEPGQNWRHDRRYQFWQSLRDELPEIGLSAPKQEYSLKKMLEWLDRQVCPSLSVLYFGLGRQAYLNYMEALATRKYDKLNEHQLAWIKYLQRSEEQAS